MSTKKQESLLDKVVLLGSSLAYLTKEATDELYDVLEKNKVIKTKEGKEAVEKVRSQIKSRQGQVRQHVVNELGKVIDELGLVTKKDLEALHKKSSPKKKAATSSAKAE